MVDCLETKHGHIGLLNPAEGETQHLDYMIDKILKDPEMIEKIQAAGADLIGGSSAAFDAE